MIPVVNIIPKTPLTRKKIGAINDLIPPNKHGSQNLSNNVHNGLNSFCHMNGDVFYMCNKVLSDGFIILEGQSVVKNNDCSLEIKTLVPKTPLTITTYLLEYDWKYDVYVL